MQKLSRPTARMLALVSLLVSSMAIAQVPTEGDSDFPRWLGLSVRAGYLMPGGQMDGSPDPFYLYEVYKGLFAAIVEPTVRIGSNVELGPWLQLSHAQMRLRCSSDDTCPGRHLRFGLQGNYHWIPSGPYNPWTGVALGYERASFNVRGIDIAYSGPDVTLQAGFDRNFGGSFWAGLFVSCSGGRYDSLEVKMNGRTGDESLRERTVHLWLGFGVRVRMAAPASTSHP
ncbi:hypothetical protein [Myxococcus faecalis]|uniref:hypothetical protein n=1 Tax=Myxococcus faecalis TaxID=3115646 RepID=UPI003CF99CCD